MAGRGRRVPPRIARERGRSCRSLPRRRSLLVHRLDEVRPVGRELMVAAVGGINELMLARVERGEAERLAEDAEVASAVLIGLLERRG